MAYKMADEGCSRKEIIRSIQETITAMEEGKYPPRRIDARWWSFFSDGELDDEHDQLDHW